MYTHLFSIAGAHKRYGDTPVLVDASVALQGGQVQALVGENGAGKSTLIRIMAGVIDADMVQFHRNGSPVTIDSPREALALGVHTIHQELSYVPELSVAENIFINRPYPRRAGIFVDWRGLNERARAILEQVGVTHVDVQAQMAKLSIGDKMLVRIASTLGENPGEVSESAQVYIMDEPTAALTNQEVDTLFAVIRRLTGVGHAILYVSHRMNEIFDIADVVTVMRNGRVVTTQPTVALTQSDVIHAMTGRSFEQVYPARQTPIAETNLLRVENLSTDALHSISFDLRRGEILGVTGLRDNGQTNLLHALLGLSPLVAGRIVLDGIAHRGGIAASWDSGVAYIPGERRAQAIVPGRAVLENMLLPHMEHFSRSGGFVNRSVERAASRQLGNDVQLRAAGVHQRVRQLSGGNQQKVVFARTLARHPRLILMDEPTRGVDVGAKVDIYHLIREVSYRGTGFIIASSDLPELICMCDRVLVMRGGRSEVIVKTEELTQASLLQLCYGSDH